MTTLTYEIPFGDVTARVFIDVDVPGLIDLDPADRDALFAFVNTIKAAATPAVATQTRTAPPPRPPSAPNPSDRPKEPKAYVLNPKPAKPKTGLFLDCDGCNRTFGSNVALGVHRARAHKRSVVSTTRLRVPSVDGPKLAPITEPTPPLLERTGPIDLDAARARAADAL